MRFCLNGASRGLLLGLLCSFAASAEQVELRYGCSLRFENARLKLTPVAFKAPGWAMFEGVAGRDGEDFSFRFANPDAVDVSGGLTLATQAINAVKFAYSFKPLKAVELSSLGLYATFPIDDYVGATVGLDDRQVEVPAVAPLHPTGELVSGRCQAISVRRRDGWQLSFRFDGTVGVRVRDQRRTRGYGNLVVWIELPHAQHYEADRVLSLVGTLTCSETMAVSGKPSPLKVVVGQDWIPVDFEADVQPGSAMDFSGSRGTDMPAGRQGRVIAKGAHFAFEDSPDVSRRFYGVNLCNYANFPETPEDARRLAARLSRCGYNSVRFHHYDWPMVSKSIDGLTVNREMQRRFDGLVAACVEYGLYMTTDFYVSRWITLPSVGRKKSALMPNGDFKSLVYVDEAVFANYMSFTRELLTHVNPYTKRRLCDEPALAAICLINEGNHGNDMGRYGRLPEWRTAWQDWIAREKSGHPEWAEVSTNVPSSCVDGSAAARAFSSFLADREKAFVARMRKFLREELKCGVPITNMNFGYGVHPEEFREVRAKDYDYVDEHYYFDHPLRVFAGRSLPTRVSSGENPLRGGAKLAVNLGDRQVPDRPYTVTEFNWCWSGKYRSACGPAVAARAVERNWAGLWRFDWSDDLGGVTNAAAKHMGPFDIAVDPLAQCSDRAAVNLYLRGDLFDPSAQVDFDRNRGALRVATPKTAVVSAPGGAIRAGALSAGLRGGFATVWATATDDRPLAESGRILLAHLTDVQNEGDEFADVSQSVLLTRGGNRRLMRAGKAEVSLKVADGDWRVWALSMSGRRQRLVPSTRANGCVRFVADVAARPESATFLYELVRREGAIDIDRLCPPRPETAAKYEAGAYPAAARPYRESALAAYRYMVALPAMTALVETGKPNQKYQHNAYVSKTHAAHIQAMLRWAQAEPAQREKAMSFARASAEYLLKELEPEDAPLAWWPPTYGRKPLEFDPKTDGPYKKMAMVGNEPEGAVKYRGEVMLLYPATVGSAFVDYWRETGDARFRDAAIGIAETYLKMRRTDGGWPLKMKLATGEAIGENTLVPNRPMELFEKLFVVTNDPKWRGAADSCFAWFEAHPLADWNWDGQFEDIRPEKPYKNPTKHNAIDTMLYMLNRFPGDKARLKMSRKILVFCEKRFVVWAPPKNHPKWPTPSVLEQYSCFTPIDASAAKMIRGYLALYRAEGCQEDLAKAKALANTVTRVQKPSGRIPTFWEGVDTGDSGLTNERYDWLNCMAAAAAALLELDAIDSKNPGADSVPETVVLSGEGPSTLAVYRPAEQKGLAPAVVICPGGGYRELCDTYEGVDMAKWLTERGIVACVLRYRLAPKWHKEAMLEDVRSALACVRGHSKEWGVNPRKVGVLGFSAGGHLACMAGTLPGAERPDFMALVYPHVSMQTGLGHEHMRVAFLGPNYRAEDICRYSGECLVSDDTPRTFLAHARTDKVCSVEHSRRFAAAMRRRGRPVEFLELETGEHGLGCGKGDQWHKWLNAFDGWLQDVRRR